MILDPNFMVDMFKWLESIIKCELPGMTDILDEHGQWPIKKPLHSEGILDPRLWSTPLKAQMNDNKFEREFQTFVKDLAIECNWHEHTNTCWKHLKANEPEDDAHCR